MVKQRMLLQNNLKLETWLPIGVAGLVTIASLLALAAPHMVYPGEEFRQAFLANDVVNLLIGVPVLLGSVWFSRRGSLSGKLFLPGALIYSTYNYLAYAVAMSHSPLFWMFVLVVGVSGLGVWQSLTTIDFDLVKTRLAGKVWERLGAGALICLGTLFFARAAGLGFGALTGAAPISAAETGVLVADLVTTPLWVLGGIQLWQKQALGYASGAGLMFQGSMLFVGLLVFFGLQPFVARVPFPLVDFMVIAGMGMVLFVPMGLFIRGIQKSG